MLESIDNALRDYAVSGDAMRWTPEPAPDVDDDIYGAPIMFGRPWHAAFPVQRGGVRYPWPTDEAREEAVARIAAAFDLPREILDGYAAPTEILFEWPDEVAFGDIEVPQPSEEEAIEIYRAATADARLQPEWPPGDEGMTIPAALSRLTRRGPAPDRMWVDEDRTVPTLAGYLEQERLSIVSPDVRLIRDRPAPPPDAQPASHYTNLGLVRVALEAMVETVVREFTDAMAEVAQIFRDHADPEPPRDSPRQRALWLRQHRNTGPQQHQRLDRRHR